MQITAESYGHAVILSCEGELTVDSLDALKRVVDHQLQEEDIRDVVLNFEEVPLVDSAALEYLLELQEKLAERLGQIKLAKLDENLSKIMEITRMASAFDQYEDLSDAIKTI